MKKDWSVSNSLSLLLDKLPTLLFVGGIHGVGKTTLCKSAFIPAGYHCITASSLIRLHKIHPDCEKLVDDIPDNQSTLIKQLRLEKDARSLLLLDGHFCLLNKEGAVEPIQIDVFKQISPNALLLVKCDPKDLATRLSNRDGKEWNQEMLSDFQDAEEEHAKRVAEALGISLTTFSNEIQNL